MTRMVQQIIEPLVSWNRRTGRTLSKRFPMAFLSTKETTGTTPSQNMVETMRRRVQQNHNDPAAAWESLWRDGITPWDLGGPTLVMIEELRNRRMWPEMTLIPGCGSGYDLVSLGRYLDESRPEDRTCTVVGLELSKTSLEKAQSVLEDSIANQGPFQQATIILYKGDFFAPPSSWNPVFSTDSYSKASDSKISVLSSKATFDFIFDYTFFCALPPDQRRQWGQHMKNLLATNGKLLTLMFPYHTSARKVAEAASRGPPYLVSLETYKGALNGHGIAIDTPLPYGSTATPQKRQGQEVVGWWGKAKL